MYGLLLAFGIVSRVVRHTFTHTFLTHHFELGYMPLSFIVMKKGVPAYFREARMLKSRICLARHDLATHRRIDGPP